MSTPIPIPLAELRFGHEAPRPINARKAGRDEGIDSLAASLRAHGVLTPFLVERQEGVPYVADGNRRLAALRADEKAGREVPLEILCVEQDAGENAEERALAANVMRLPLHEADQYEAFWKLHHVDGLTVKDIAGRFGLPKKRVDQLLALGKLHPKIREAWRAGTIGREEAQAFTLAPSEGDQAKLYDKLAKERGLRAWVIYRELGAGDHQTDQLLTFVGKEAYRKAGGVVVEDLFGKNHIVAQPALLKRLADEKLRSEKVRLLADGWCWVDNRNDVTDPWNYDHLSADDAATPEEAARLKELKGKLEAAEEAEDPSPEDSDAAEELEAQIEQLEAEIQARGFTAEQKATAGCFVSISHRGELQIEYGRIAPKAARRAAGKDAAGKGKKSSKPAISNALANELSHRLTEGLRKALVASPHVALAALVAGAQAQDGPEKIRIGVTDAYGRFLPGEQGKRSFAALFPTLVAMRLEDLLEAAAGVAAAALSAGVHRADQDPMKEHKGLPLLIEKLDGAAVREAMGWAFDAKAWCEKVSKALVLQAVTEAAGDDAAKLLAGKPKAELAKAAATTLREAGWLPPQLRTIHYQGPVAAPKAKAGRKTAA